MRKPFMVEFTGTPEAGKTTAITNIANELSARGKSVMVLKESAEKLPSEIPKGTWYANLWMHYKTQAGLLKASFAACDIVLVDRGLVDSNFYGKKFLWEGACTKEQYENFRRQFMKELFPDFLIMLTVPPRTAIQRRGGEGRLVTEDYIEKYNKMLLRYYDEVQCPKCQIDTSEFDVDKMNQTILDVILNKIP